MSLPVLGRFIAGFALILILPGFAFADTPENRTDSLLTKKQCESFKQSHTQTLFETYRNARTRLRAPKAQYKVLINAWVSFSEAELKELRAVAGAPRASTDSAALTRMMQLVEHKVSLLKTRFDKIVCPDKGSLLPPKPEPELRSWWESKPLDDTLMFYSSFELKPEGDECVLSRYTSDGGTERLEGFPIIRTTSLKGPSRDEMRRGDFFVSYTIVGRRNTTARINLVTGRIRWVDPGEQMVYGQTGTTDAQLSELAESEAQKQLSVAYPECTLLPAVLDI